MIDYGVGPASDEIEISVFGPGYGEAIAVHLGENNWILIDSCIDPETKEPASLSYLDRIGVCSDSVIAIIASHWHDDHVRGISVLAERFVKADFFISGVFNDVELLAFLFSHSPESGPSQTGGAKELVKVIESNKSVIFTNQRMIITQKTLLNRPILVTAFSPTQHAQSNMLQHLANFIPKSAGPVNHAPDLKPNLSSVVVHVDFGDDAILLGSDLEDHGEIGWKGVIDQSWCLSRTKASAYKVAHHGSKTAHHDGIWSNLLSMKPISLMTPFIRGSVSLPTITDQTRIKDQSSSTYLSSLSSKKPEMDKAIEKRLMAISSQLSKVNAGFGSIRLRKRIGEEWRVELFGRAIEL